MYSELSIIIIVASSGMLAKRDEAKGLEVGPGRGKQGGRDKYAPNLGLD